MTNLPKNTWREMLSGASLLATGGGGTIRSALLILRKIKKPIRLLSLDILNKNSFVCTVFGVGGKQKCDPIVASQKAFALFQKVVNKKISAIIPVEVGPMAIANVMFIASELKIPLLDSDIVGLRSSPEVFLETISIKGLSRTPCAIADDKGNSAILWESQNLEQLEQFFRNFALSVGGDAFVAGYPLQVASLNGVISDGSISEAQKNGNVLKRLRSGKISLREFCKEAGWNLLDSGTILSVRKETSRGFAEGKYTIQSDNNMLAIIFKNENLVFLRNSKVILTCPDSISLLDLRSSEAINNFENNINKRVAILGKKAIPIWRTREGKKLFSPKNLGFNYKQKLLS